MPTRALGTTLSPTAPPETVAQAEQDAARAAAVAGVRVEQLHTDEEVRTVIEVATAIWGPDIVSPANQLRAFAHAGGTVLAASDISEGETIGFALGFLGWQDGLHLHSHQTGVRPGHRSRGVGYALKLAQRAVCLAHDIVDMRWTFDPLVLRNARFNLHALGAVAIAFHLDFYGRMGDAINEDDASDRLEAAWDLLAPLPDRKDEVASPVGPTLLADLDGLPRRSGRPPQAGDRLAVPADYERLRRTDPARARAWRAATRQVLAETYAAGLRVGTADRQGYQLIRNEDNR